MKTITIVLITGLSVVPAVSARGEVIFSNLTPSPAVYTGSWGLSGPSVGGALAQQDAGSPFVATRSATLDSIEVALTHGSGPSLYDVLLLSDANGLPGNVLETLTAVNVPSTLGCPSNCAVPVTVVTSVTHPLLQVDTQYWVAVTTFSSTIGYFMLNLTSDTGLAYRNYGGPWMPALPVQNTAVAFAVNGTPVASSVPEPAVLVLLASALGASWTRRQRATAARARRPQSSAQKNKP